MKDCVSISLQTDPKRVKRALPIILKTMKQEDRVMIIGVTKSPFGEQILHSSYCSPENDQFPFSETTMLCTNLLDKVANIL